MSMGPVVLCQQCLAQLPDSTVVCLVVVQPLQEGHMQSIPTQQERRRRREGGREGGREGVHSLPPAVQWRLTCVLCVSSREGPAAYGLQPALL